MRLEVLPSVGIAAAKSNLTTPPLNNNPGVPAEGEAPHPPRRRPRPGGHRDGAAHVRAGAQGAVQDRLQGR